MFSAARLLKQQRSTTRVVRRFMGSDMPVPQSQHAPMWGGHTVAKEGWEGTFYFYCIASVILQVAIITAAPETSIESWARPEAQARLKLAAQGQTEFEFGKHYADVLQEQQTDLYSKFSERAIIPGDDDDDDDDDEGEDEVTMENESRRHICY